MKHVLGLTTVLSIAALALMIPTRAALAASTSDSTTIPKLFDEVKHHAAQANYDAEVLNSFGYRNITWQSHAAALNTIKDHANDLIEDYYQLQRVRASGTPAQQAAIDRLEPLIRQMATELTKAIQMLSENPARVNMPNFRNQVQRTYLQVNAVYKSLCQCTGKNAKNLMASSRQPDQGKTGAPNE